LSSSGHRNRRRAHAVPPAAAPSATARAAGPLASIARNQPNAKGAQKIGAPPNRQIDPIEHPLVVIDEPIGENLFGNAPEALPMMPSRRVELRARLKTVVRRRRGLQSRVAEALNLSRHTVANILAGREDFTPIADSLVRRWLDGDPVGPGWPELPANEDENDDAAAA
jgi:hypothetical protein